MADGKNAGIQYRPLQGDLASDIINQEQLNATARQEQRLIEDRKAKAKAAKDLKAQQGLSRAKALNLYDTGSDTLNGVLAQAVTIATNEYPKIFEILDDSTGKYSQAEKLKAQLKYDNILNLPENLKLMTNSIMKEYSDYQAGVKSGAIFEEPDYEKRFQNGYKGVNISIDDDGRPVGIFRKGVKDMNEDGLIDEFDIETMDSLMDLDDRPQFQSQIKYDTAVQKHAEKLVSAVNQTSNGFSSTKTTGLEVDMLNDTVKRALYDQDNGEPSRIMKSFLREMGYDYKNPSKEDLDKVETAYKNDINLRMKRGQETTFDSSAYVSNKRENRLNKDSKATLGETVSPTQQTYGIYYGNLDPNKVNSVNIQGNLKIPAIKTEKGDFVSNATPHNVTRDKYGRMVMEVSYQETKTETLSDDNLAAELEQAANDQDFAKLAALQMAVKAKGGNKVTLPGQIKRKDITVAKEDEADLAGRLGYSIDALDDVIYKSPETKAATIKSNGIGSKYNN